jgi:hypothetical protein
MSGRRMDDSGQIHTIEGIVAGMVIILALIYITGSITFVSPQTEKTTVMKMSIKAQDILNVLSTADQPGNYTNPLARCIARWDGGVADPSHETGPGETSITWLNSKIQSLLPTNSPLMYNVELLYVNDTMSAATGHLVFEDRYIIFKGDPQDNSVTASKLVVLNYYDVNSTIYSKWNNTVVPKTVEVKLSLWSI